MKELKDPENEIFVAQKFPQILAAASATLGVFGLGNVIGWTAPALPDIEAHGDFNNLKGSSEMASWIGAIIALAALLAGFITGFLVQTLGRKVTILILTVPFVAGWLILAFAESTTMLLVGRFVTGFCGGAFTIIIPMYASEISEIRLRGTVGSFLGLFMVSGVGFVYVIGKWLSWKWISIVCGFIPVILAATMVFMPETPRFFLSKGNRKEALKSLMWLRGAKYDSQVEPELKTIEISIEASNAQSSSFKDLLAGPVLKPTSITIILMFLQQWSGIKAVIFYSTSIFKEAGTEGTLSNLDSAIIVGAVQIIFSSLATFLIERVGRKILLITSEFGMGISLIALGVFFYMKEEGKSEGLGWLPLTSLAGYIISYNIGMGPLPWTIVGELLPLHVKGLTSSIASAFCWLCAFLVTKFYKNLMDAMMPYGCYWLFAGICLAGGVFCILFVPETKGKSFDEIQAFFNGKKVKREP